MIKFFRSIRKKLLEHGKTANYLKYAIGEIVLVVIGILIALQINNWNEERKSYKVETKLLSEMKISIERDIERTNLLIDRRAKLKNEAIQSLLIYLLEKDKVEDSILIKKFFSSLISLSFSYDKGPYESIKSLGLDKISNDTLRGKIVRTYEVNLPLAIIFVDADSDIQNNKRQILLDRILDKYFEKIGDEWQIMNSINFQVAKNSKDFMELMYLEQQVAKNYIERLEDARNQLQNLLNDLEHELTKRQ